MMPTFRFCLPAILLWQTACVTVVQTLPTARFETVSKPGGPRVRLDAVHVVPLLAQDTNTVSIAATHNGALKVQALPAPQAWMEHAVLQELAAAGIETTEDCAAPGLTVLVRDFSFTHVIEDPAPNRAPVTRVAPFVEATLYYPATQKTYVRGFNYEEELPIDEDYDLATSMAQLAHDTHMALGPMASAVFEHVSGLEAVETDVYTVLPEAPPQRPWHIRAAVAPRWVNRSLEAQPQDFTIIGTTLTYHIPSAFSLPVALEGQYAGLRLGGHYYRDITQVDTGPSQGFGFRLQYQLTDEYALGADYDNELWRGTFTDENNRSAPVSVPRQGARLWASWRERLRFGLAYGRYSLNQPLYIAVQPLDSTDGELETANARATVNQVLAFVAFGSPAIPADEIEFQSGLDYSMQLGIGGGHESWAAPFGIPTKSDDDGVAMQVRATLGWQVFFQAGTLGWHVRAGAEVSAEGQGTDAAFNSQNQQLASPSNVFYTITPYVSLAVHD